MLLKMQLFQKKIQKVVTTEINNFKAKKMSAITPLLDNFKLQVEKGKSKEELKELAENILVEIKTGPPYVYGQKKKYPSVIISIIKKDRNYEI